MDYLTPGIQEDRRNTLKHYLFSKFKKVPSLYNLCVDKINEEHSTYSVLPEISKISNDASEVVINHLQQKDHFQREVVLPYTCEEIISVKPIFNVPTLFNLCLNTLKTGLCTNKDNKLINLKPKLTV